MPQGTVVPLEGGENHTAFLRIVRVVEQILGHALSLPELDRPDIGAAP